jgi:dTDP-4-amino-4,6-dideoxygalactose transaminase
LNGAFLVPRDALLERQFLKWAAQTAPFGARADSGGCVRIDVPFARTALFHGAAALGLRAGDHVLLPSYICEAAVLPLAARELVCDFYDVTADCRIDVAAIEAAIGPRTRAILVVHYFGFAQDLAAIRNLCDTRGIALIEDCAHLITGTDAGRPLGSTGDISVFSWRKFVPVREGATLLLNRPGLELRQPWRAPGLLANCKEFAALVESAAQRPGRERSLLARAFAIASGRRPGKYAPQAAGAVGPAEDEGERFDPRDANRALKDAAAAVLRHSSFQTLIARRRRNYERLLAMLTSLCRATPLRPILPEGICPWVLPVQFSGLEDAHRLMRRAGIPAVSWGGVRPKAVAGDEFPVADVLYRNLVFLPVHQSLTEADLATTAEVVARVVR